MTRRLLTALVFVVGVAVGLGFGLGLGLGFGLGQAWPVAYAQSSGHAQETPSTKSATRTWSPGDGPTHHYVRTRLDRVFSVDRALAESVAECITYGSALSCRWR